MKFKYYLRGLGLGIIFTSIVFMVSYRFNGEELTDAQIIQRARALGMTMENDSSFEEESESVNKPQTVLDAQSDHKEQSTKKEDSEISNEKKSLQETGQIQETERTQGTELPRESEQTKDLEQAQDDKTVRIKILKGEGCRLVAEDLQANGVIEDSEDFRNYMKEKGLDKKLKAGNFRIPKGATYQEIADLLIGS